MARWYVSDPCSPASILQYVLRIRGIAISNFAIVGIIEVTLAGQRMIWRDIGCATMTLRTDFSYSMPGRSILL